MRTEIAMRVSKVENLAKKVKFTFSSCQLKIEKLILQQATKMICSFFFLHPFLNLPNNIGEDCVMCGRSGSISGS